MLPMSGLKFQAHVAFENNSGGVSDVKRALEKEQTVGLYGAPKAEGYLGTPRSILTGEDLIQQLARPQNPSLRFDIFDNRTSGKVPYFKKGHVKVARQYAKEAAKVEIQEENTPSYIKELRKYLGSKTAVRFTDVDIDKLANSLDLFA